MSATYLTTPIYYANDRPHIGHAYTTIAADALTRAARLRGRDVFLLTGTDEHGINIERVAAAHGRSPQIHVDEIAAAFQSLWARLDIRVDRFVRTTEPAHQRAALALWHRLQARGDLYRATYCADYCPRCEAFVAPDDLVAGGCPIHASPCEPVGEENWFFRLSRYRSALTELVRDTDFVQPVARRNEILGQLAAGLDDFSVSRRQVTWGIPVPESPGEVLYVWIDALASYLTGVGFPDDLATFERYWPADVHLVGKEIIRFHCLYWPALLLSAGLPLPRHVFAHGWLTKDGRKISKSTGNVIDPVALVNEFGADAVRYYFLRQVPFGQDGDYTRESFVRTYNADLANTFGNLVQRTTTLAARSAVSLGPAGLEASKPAAADARGRDERDVPGEPEPAIAPDQAPLAQVALEVERRPEGVGRPDPVGLASGNSSAGLAHSHPRGPEAQLVAAARELAARSETAYAACAPHDAVAALIDFVHAANRYLDARAPWRLVSAHPAREVVLVHAVEAARLAAWYASPLFPAAAAEAHCRLAGRPPELGGGTFAPPAWQPTDLRGQGVVHSGPPLFPRVPVGRAAQFAAPAGLVY